MNQECSIVRDLLPLYAERLTSPETAAFVEKHLRTCADCRAALQETQAPPALQPRSGRRAPAAFAEKAGAQAPANHRDDGSVCPDGRDIRSRHFECADLFPLYGRSCAGDGGCGSAGAYVPC